MAGVRTLPAAGLRCLGTAFGFLASASILAFALGMYDALTLDATMSTTLRRRGSRQNDPGWCSMVSLVPVPSGSNAYFQVPTVALEDFEMMRLFRHQVGDPRGQADRGGHGHLHELPLLDRRRPLRDVRRGHPVPTRPGEPEQAERDWSS